MPEIPRSLGQGGKHVVGLVGQRPIPGIDEAKSMVRITGEGDRGAVGALDPPRKKTAAHEMRQPDRHGNVNRFTRTQRFGQHDRLALIDASHAPHRGDHDPPQQPERRGQCAGAGIGYS